MVGHWEIERRFLARDDAPSHDQIRITQVYLNLDDLRVTGRVLEHRTHGMIADFGGDAMEIDRILNTDDNAIVRLRTIEDAIICGVKSQMIGGRRREFEVLTPFDPGCLEGNLPVIEKNRCLWRGNDGQIWEIDRYIQPQLNFILAEVELEDIGQKFDIPHWVLEEVTDDPMYTNSELAKSALSAGGGI